MQPRSGWGIDGHSADRMAVLHRLIALGKRLHRNLVAGWHGITYPDRVATDDDAIPSGEVAQCDHHVVGGMDSQDWRPCGIDHVIPPDAGLGYPATGHRQPAESNSIAETGPVSSLTASEITKCGPQVFTKANLSSVPAGLRRLSWPRGGP
jgi:hypothetical protein